MAQKNDGAIFPTTISISNPTKKESTPYLITKVYKKEDEWKNILTPEQYHITREKGTEPPFTGKYHDFFEHGVYQCICCAYDLFSSEEKFKSKEGWPAFWDTINETAVTSALDLRFGLVRLEVMCARCDAHLGHVFNDGPPPTGLRYCIDSVALNFVAL